jgi:hypothetical protein
VRPGYGYGFYYGNAWVPVTPYGNQYVVVQQPVVYRSAPRYYSHSHRYWR